MPPQLVVTQRSGVAVVGCRRAILQHAVVLVLLLSAALACVHALDSDADGTNSGSSAPLPLADLDQYDSKHFLPVTWAAPFLSGGGYCSEAISFAMSLAPFLGKRLSLMQHGDAYNGQFVSQLDQTTLRTLQPLFQNPHQFEPPRKKKDAVDAVHRGAIAICHSEPGAWEPARYHTSICPHPHAMIKIGRTMFETDRLPSGWSDRINQLDYVWVPTAFHRDVFAAGGVESQKIVVIPEPVDTDFYSPEYAATSAPFAFPMEDASRSVPPFRFLSIFKWEERKGWQVLLESFMREFASNEKPADDVVLYILTSAYHSDEDFQESIDTFVATLSWSEADQRPAHLPLVRLIRSGVSSESMPSLYAGASAFVLPSRGEGWGRPHVEAMSMGLPVIATEWSGPSEYMTQTNSFPLRHDGFVTIAEGAFRGHKWAQPSVTHLRELMREVVRDPKAARVKGKQARADMVAKYCQECVAKIVIAELARIQDIRPEGAASPQPPQPERKDEL